MSKPTRQDILDGYRGRVFCADCGQLAFRVMQQHYLLVRRYLCHKCNPEQREHQIKTNSQ